MHGPNIEKCTKLALKLGHLLYCAWSQQHREVYKSTPEMRTPPLIMAAKAVPRVSGIV